jgi:hypothetical protein
MNISLLVRKCRGALLQSRVSPVSRPALLLMLGLAATGLVAGRVNEFGFASLPNIVPYLLGIVAVDVTSQFAPKTKLVEAVQVFIYGVMNLAVISLSGVLAAYGMQRFAFPLQDTHLESADLALGFNWFAFAHWVDRHALVQTVFHFVYHTISAQIAFTLGVLAFTHKSREVRIYILAFAIAFVTTIFISAMMPAAGPITFANRAAFHLLKFTGATPIDQLLQLRAAGPLILHDGPGGIATFPSFHATIAVLTPLALRNHKRIFAAVVIVDVIMLAATLTEGAHYFTDLLAGGAMAFYGYYLARYIIGLEDRARAPANELYSAAQQPV